jgi:hypothetical protein
MSCKSAELDDPYRICLTTTAPYETGNSPAGSMEHDLTPVPMGGQYQASTPPQYDEDDRNEIINLIRSLESSPVQPEPESFNQPLTPNSDSLFDDRDISKYYAEDFDTMFNF